MWWDFDLCLRDVLWLLYLVLNAFSVLPMYCAEVSSVVMVALYMTASLRHCPAMGQSFLFLQLHCRVAGFVVVLFRIRLLWLFIIWLIFWVQL